MKCEYCDNEIPAGAVRCPACGAPVRNPAPAPAAPAAVPAAAVQQGVPGATVVQGVPGGVAPVQVVINNAAPVSPYAPPPPIEYKKRSTFILLGIFLGCFGIHNFYLGFAGRGVSQLLLTLILFATPLTCAPVYLWVLFEILFVREDARAVRLV